MGGYTVYPALTGVTQQAPDCDMVLVHDDDLEFLADAVSYVVSFGVITLTSLL
jgi:hypothetical protein